MTQANIEATGSIGLKIGRTGILSEFNYLNESYGFTNNSLYSPSFEGLDYAFGKSINFFSLQSRVTEQVLSKNIFQQIGPFNGIVLRIDSVKTGKQASEETEEDRLASGTDSPVTTFVIRVRIPELHSFIPIPKTVVDAYIESSAFDSLSDSNKPCQNRLKIDNDIINMHPQFSGYIREGEASVVPHIGSYVKVDFANKTAFTGGFYIGPLTNQATITTTKLYDIAYGAFNKGASNTEEANIANQAPGQFESPDVNESSQVATGKPVQKPSWHNEAASQAPLGGTDF